MQKSIGQQLLEAAETNNIGLVKQLIGQGASLTATDTKGEYNVLQLAAKCGSTSVVEYLVLLENCPLNAQSKSSGRTALHLASQYGHWFVVDALLNAKCDFNLRTKLFGRTALHWAAVSGQYTIVERLLLAGSDVNTQDKSCAERASEVAQLAGFSLSVPALSIGNTALHLAAQLGHKTTVQALLTGGAKVNITQASGRTALHLAAMGGHSDVIELLVKAGADVNLQTQRLQTPLHFAASGGHQQAAQMLLDYGCNTQFKNKQNMRPIDIAQNKGHDEIVEIIIESDKEKDQNTEPEHRKAVPRELHLRGTEVFKVYEKACEEGKKKVFRARVMFVGHQGVGKTSLARCLRGETFHVNEPSTNGIETDPSTCVIDVNNWKPNKTEDGCCTTSDDIFNHSVVKHMLSALRRNVGQDAEDDVSQQSQETSDVLEKSTSTETRQDDKEVDDDTTIPTEAPEKSGEDTISTVRDSAPAYSVEETSPPVELPEEIAELLQQLAIEGALQEDEDDAAEPEITLCFWDFGGQSVFYTTHQVFLTNRAVYILVVDITQPLDSIVAPETRQGVHEVIEEQTNMTVKDYIHFWLNSIHAHASLPTHHSCQGQQESKLTDQAVSSPVVIIVATHKDQLQSQSGTEREAVIEKYLTELRKYLGSHVAAAHEHVLPKIYVVDNSHRLQTGDDDPELSSLKEQLSLVVRQQDWMGEEIPIKWLRLEEKMKKLKEGGKKYLALIELQGMADNLGIKDRAELKVILQFYHDLGDIIYFNEPHLQNLIILDPQWLVDVFKSVITVRAYQDQDRLCRRYWDKLDNEGILETQLIEKIWGKLGLLQYKDLLLDIMQKFDLICPCMEKSELDVGGVSCHGDSSWGERSVCSYGDLSSTEKILCSCGQRSSYCDLSSTEKILCSCGQRSCYGVVLHDAGNARCVCAQYFVPSLLKTERVMASVISPTSVSCPLPLYFHFNEGFLPNGLYHRLVTRCLRHWPCNTNLYRDCVLFELDEDHDLLLRKQDSDIMMDVFFNPIEGQVPGEDMPSPDWCNQARQVVQHHLKKLISQWVPGLAFRTTFKCTCPVHKTDTHPETKSSPFIEASPEVITRGSVKCSAHRRVSTVPLRRWFALQRDSNPEPTPVQPVEIGNRVGLFLEGKLVTHLQEKLTLQELERYKICGLVKEVPYSVYTEMAKLLDIPHPLLADYKLLASELGFSNVDIDQFALGLQHGKRPTGELLHVTGQRGATIKTIMTALINIDRHDALRELLKGMNVEYQFEF